MSMRRIHRDLALVVALLAITGAVGFAVQGWVAALLWPLGLCTVFLMLGAAWHVVDFVITFSRHNAKIESIKARVRRLSTEQLQKLVQTPSHGDAGLARVELMRRGVDARPSKAQLSAMLTSGDSILCGQAMAYVSIFYPETRLPLGSSNHDPPELWRARVAELWGGRARP